MTNCYTGDNTSAPPLPLPATKIGVRNSYRRVGIVFYTQLRRHFTRRRLEAEALGLERFELPTGPLEEGLRCRVFRLARPRMWERLKYCLDKWVRYHPEWEEEFRRVRREWRGTETAEWPEPHPILATLRQKAQSGLA